MRTRNNIFHVPLMLAMGLSACATSHPPTQAELRSYEELLDLGKAAGAYRQLVELRERFPSDFDIARLLVQAGSILGRESELSVLYEGERPIDFYVRELIAASRRHFSEGVALLERASRAAPDEAELHYRLAALLLAGMEAEATMVQAGTSPMIAPGRPIADNEALPAEFRDSEIDAAIAGAMAKIMPPVDRAVHYQQAYDHLQRARSLGLQNAAFYLRSAQALAGLGQWADAMDALVSSIHAHPSTKEIRLAVFMGQSIVADRRRLPPDLRDSLVPLLDELGRSPPQNDSLIVRLLSLTQDYPVPAVHAALGLAYLKRGEETRGMSYLRKAQQDDPRDPFPFMSMGAYLLESHNAGGAVSVLMEAVAGNPLDAQVQRLLLMAARQSQNQDAEHSALVLLAALEPNEMQNTLDLGDWEQRRGNSYTAERYFQEVLAADSRNLVALYQLALLEWERAQSAAEASSRAAHRDRAQRHLDRLLALAPEHVLGNRVKEKIAAFVP